MNKRRTKFVRTCPKCLKDHRTTTKSSGAICNNCKEDKKKQTKKYKKAQAKKELKLKDKAWSQEIRIEPCLICGTTEHLHAHHIIPREIKKTRHIYQNGVSLCILHHKYSYECSAHKNPAMFLKILKQKNPDQYDYIQYLLSDLQEKYESQN
jgi:hypothetical protein